MERDRYVLVLIHQSLPPRCIETAGDLQALRERVVCRRESYSPSLLPHPFPERLVLIDRNPKGAFTLTGVTRYEARDWEGAYRVFTVWGDEVYASPRPPKLEAL